MMAQLLHPPDTFEVVLAICIFVCASAYMFIVICFTEWLVRQRASRIIDRWCKVNNFKLVSKKLDWLSSLRGPFAFDLSSNRPVYAVTVEDQRGQLRKATVACGAMVFGLLGIFSSDRIVVVWDRVSSDKKEVEKPPWGGLE